jgi:hypothetical protein
MQITHNPYSFIADYIFSIGYSDANFIREPIFSVYFLIFFVMYDFKIITIKVINLYAESRDWNELQKAVDFLKKQLFILIG